MLHRIALMCILVATALKAASSITSIDALSWDEDDRLSTNYLLYSDNEKCETMLKYAWSMRTDFKRRDLVPMTQVFADEMGWHNNNVAATSSDICKLIAVDRGVPKDMVQHVVPTKMNEYNLKGGSTDEMSDRLHHWIADVVMRVEVGFLNWMPNTCEMYWINDERGSKHFLGDLERKEKATKWQTTTLGHRFEIIDKVTKESYGIFEAEYSRFVVLGKTPEEEYMGYEVNHEQIKRDVQATFQQEWRRAHTVTRTFTELGFNKARLPADLWASMLTYYYNNKKSCSVEEWGGKGVFVNWWEVPSWMIGIPWGLKTYWQARLKELVEEWSGVQLELTDIYGMREYKDGARLLTHVDREETHAASLIINVDQVAIREPWMLEIYDFANRLHEIEMQPGDIVYYESARCLHGRMSALKGESYVNLFAHYRPIGDPKWYLKENPETAPEQLHDVESPTVSDFVKDLFHEFVSPKGHVLAGPTSLFQYWASETRKAADSHGFTGFSSEL
jgi:hypothetical protein